MSFPVSYIKALMKQFANRQPTGFNPTGSKNEDDIELADNKINCSRQGTELMSEKLPTHFFLFI